MVCSTQFNTSARLVFLDYVHLLRLLHSLSCFIHGNLYIVILTSFIYFNLYLVCLNRHIHHCGRYFTIEISRWFFSVLWSYVLNFHRTCATSHSWFFSYPMQPRKRYFIMQSISVVWGNLIKKISSPSYIITVLVGLRTCTATRRPTSATFTSHGHEGSECRGLNKAHSRNIQPHLTELEISTFNIFTIHVLH